MKICATSDTHGLTPEIPDCDLFIHAGDVCPITNHEILSQMVYLNMHFRPWWSAIPARKKILVPGNHDFIFEASPYLIHKEIMDDVLIDQLTMFENIHIWGSPWTPNFHDWAFMPKNQQPEHDEFLLRKTSIIPDRTDILVSHGPPYGVLDKNIKNENCGNKQLAEWCKKNKPKHVIFGHIHESLGKEVTDYTTYRNVSYLSHHYDTREPWGKVIVLDFDDVPF